MYFLQTSKGANCIHLTSTPENLQVYFLRTTRTKDCVLHNPFGYQLKNLTLIQYFDQIYSLYSILPVEPIMAFIELKTFLKVKEL